MSEKSLIEQNKRRMLELATFLRETRINSGYTQAEVAASIKLSRTSISKIENMGFFRIQHLYLLADFYEVPINELFSEIA
jgi:transcriptional regulator with XRE-family HTH domain